MRDNGKSFSIHVVMNRRLYSPAALYTSNLVNVQCNLGIVLVLVYVYDRSWQEKFHSFKLLFATFIQIDVP